MSGPMTPPLAVEGRDRFAKLTAIIRASALERVEQRLQELGAPGLTVSRVKGYGEDPNFFTRDWLGDQVRLEIFVEQARAAALVEAIIETARTGAAGDGIVAVLPVEALYHVRTGA